MTMYFIRVTRTSSDIEGGKWADGKCNLANRLGMNCHRIHWSWRTDALHRGTVCNKFPLPFPTVPLTNAPLGEPVPW